jgi:hypothetical protein
MSAINLYTTKTQALYFKDSQRNSFYEFGGIQLIPAQTYTQLFNYSYTITKVESFKVSDGSLLNDLTAYITIDTVSSVKYISIDLNNSFPYDYANNLIYLRFTYSGSSYLYSNPFYYTSLDEDRTTKFTYSNNSTYDDLSIGLKVWFRQKSRQSELTTYYESSTKNTVTQAIKTHNLEMYESEFMSIEDLIMTAEILESPYLYIGNKRYSLFEAVKIPELTQQENFGKIKLTLAPNN